MCSIEVVSSPSPWVFKFGREVVEGTWASRGVLHGPFSPEGERHPAPTLFPGIKSLTVYWSFRQHWEMLAGKSTPFRKRLWSRACHHAQTSTISATLLHLQGLLLAS